MPIATLKEHNRPSPDMHVAFGIYTPKVLIPFVFGVHKHAFLIKNGTFLLPIANFCGDSELCISRPAFQDTPFT